MGGIDINQNNEQTSNTHTLGKGVKEGASWGKYFILNASNEEGSAISEVLSIVKGELHILSNKKDFGKSKNFELKDGVIIFIGNRIKIKKGYTDNEPKKEDYKTEIFNYLSEMKKKYNIGGEITFFRVKKLYRDDFEVVLPILEELNSNYPDFTLKLGALMASGGGYHKKIVIDILNNNSELKELLLSLIGNDIKNKLKNPSKYSDFMGVYNYLYGKN